MGERTGAGTSPSQTDGYGDDYAKIAELLNSEAWEKRLEEARRQRERILAEKASREAPVTAGPKAEPPPAPDVASPGVARVAAALQALREAEPAPSAFVVPFRNRAAETVEPPPAPAAPPGPAAIRTAPRPTARDAPSAPRPVLPVPPSAAGPAAAPARLETALARVRTGGTGAAPRPGLRRDWRVFAAGAFALGLTVGGGATQLPRLFERGADVAEDVGTLAGPLPAPATGASPMAAPEGDRPRLFGPSGLAAPQAMDDPAPATAPVARPPTVLRPSVTDIAAPVTPDPAPPVDGTTSAPRVAMALPAMPALAAPRTEPGGPAPKTAAPAPPSLLAELAPFAVPAGGPDPEAVRVAALGPRPALAALAARPVAQPRDPAAPVPVHPPAPGLPAVTLAVEPPGGPPAEAAPPAMTAARSGPFWPRPVPALAAPTAAGPAPERLAALARPALWSGSDAALAPAAPPSAVVRALPGTDGVVAGLALPRAPSGAVAQGLPPDHPTAAAPPPPPPVAPNAFVSVFVPDTIPDSALEEITGALAHTGYRVSDPARVGFAVAETSVRYYHRSDAGLARSVAERIGAVARDFTDFGKRPAPGRVELWIAGGGRGAAPVAPAAVRRSAEPTEAQIAARLKERLIRKLRDAKNQ